MRLTKGYGGWTTRLGRQDRNLPVGRSILSAFVATAGVPSQMRHRKKNHQTAPAIAATITVRQPHPATALASSCLLADVFS